MNPNQETYTRWCKISLNICKGNKSMSGDILNDTLLYMIEKGTQLNFPTDDPRNDYYIAVSLKNRYLMERGKACYPVSLDGLEIGYEDEDFSEREETEALMLKKIETINDIVSKLGDEDIGIFLHYFIYGNRPMDMSRAMGRSYTWIYNKINGIKKIIKEHG